MKRAALGPEEVLEKGDAVVVIGKETSLVARDGRLVDDRCWRHL